MKTLPAGAAPLGPGGRGRPGASGGPGDPAGPPGATSPRPGPWRASRLLSAPHRLGFFAAALLLALSALWWLGALAARQAGAVLPWAVPPAVAHGLLMTHGFMPLFIVGFLFTAGPKWLALPEVPAATLLRPVLAMLAGWGLTLPGVHLHALLAAAGLGLTAAGWSLLVARFAGLLRRSPAPDRLHAGLVTLGCGIGALALWGAAAALALGEVTAARVAVQVSVWGFLAPVFATVSHRMIPFFTASALPALDAWRPAWLLWTLWAVLAVAGAFAVAELLWWPLPAAWRWVQVGVEAPAAVLLLWLALRWGLVQSLRIRLLAMLHGGFVWLGLAFALAAVSHARMALSADMSSLGLAPTHALTMGYLGVTLVAMVTRVASGHSGRPLAVDGLAWALYGVLQVAVLLRVASSLGADSGLLVLLAALAWAVACVAWALRYGGWLGRPRIDGRPG